MSNRRPIAVIDSGLGGISVLRHLVRELPSENFVYFGDTANAPYGSKTSETVCHLTASNIKMLLSQYRAKAIVIACNTATGAAAAKCRELFANIPIIGIEPAIKPAVTGSGKENPTVLVMATPLTLSQDKFTALAQKYNPNSSIIALPCPGLAEAIENEASETEMTELLERLLSGVERDAVDSIVLGCTHYPLVSEYIARLIPGAVIFDGGLGTAMQTRRRLEAEDLLSDLENEGSVTVINSAHDPNFEDRALKYLKSEGK